MNRATWFVAGAATGVYGLVKARRAASNLTPDGIAARAAAVGAGLRVFTSELTSAMAEREAELREQLALLPRAAALDAGGGRPVVPAMIAGATRPELTPDPTRREDSSDGHR